MGSTIGRTTASVTTIVVSICEDAPSLGVKDDDVGEGEKGCKPNGSK